jgi:hypothetical protein
VTDPARIVRRPESDVRTSPEVRDDEGGSDMTRQHGGPPSGTGSAAVLVAAAVALAVLICLALVQWFGRMA